MALPHLRRRSGIYLLALTSAVLTACGGTSQSPNSAQTVGETGVSIPEAPADRRARELLAQMTLPQKLAMVHGYGMPNLANQVGNRDYYVVPADAIQAGAGFIPGIPALGIPDTNIADSAISVAMPRSLVTSFPSNVALAATWDNDLSYLYGKRIAIELRELGFTTGLGGGINLARDPRGGRLFEYMGEDPVLAGEMVAQRTIGTQSQKVIATIKHYAMNGYETNRFISNSVVDEQTLRETELLGFEIGVIKSQPGNIMCSYNLVNGIYACEHPQLLNDWLKKEWGFKGIVQSDWGATPSTVAAANNGLDESQPGQAADDTPVPDNLKKFFGTAYFLKGLVDAVANGTVPMSRLDDMVLRRLRTMVAVGVMDSPPTKSLTIKDPLSGNQDALRVSESAMVLLKNETASGDGAPVLPVLAGAAKRIAVIGNYADVGVMAGSGSGGSIPLTNNAVTECREPLGALYAVCPMYLPSAPLAAIREKYPNATVTFSSGRDADEAASAAAAADVAIVFAGQWQNEGTDNADLSLPGPATDTTGVFKYDQDALIASVAAKAKRTVVVLETGGPVKMPWLSRVHAVLQAWYPGVQGHKALANILAGDANPTGKLPVTFPASENDLPQKVLPKNMGSLLGLDIFPMFAASLVQPTLDAKGGPGTFDKMRTVTYDEKLLLGYKWYDAKKITPLFRFGHGLSYTTYRYSDLSVQAATGGDVTVSFSVTNTGRRAGVETAQVYAGLPAGVPGNEQPPQRLVGWSRVALAPNETRKVSVTVPRKYISTWDAQKTHAWRLNTGSYLFRVNDSSDMASPNALTQSLSLNGS